MLYTGGGLRHIYLNHIKIIIVSAERRLAGHNWFCAIGNHRIKKSLHLNILPYGMTNSFLPTWYIKLLYFHSMCPI